ncbi:MAG TPA: DUF3147 family protein [Methanoregula sp.]|nr:DUF3147 family protein [Methanoregula sp.]
MDLSFFIIRFLVGGSIIVGVTYLALQVDPKYGGILAAAPITTMLAFLFTYSESGVATSRELLISMFWFAIPTILFILVLWLLMARYPVLPSLGGAFLFWLVAVVAMNRVLAGL